MRLSYMAKRNVRKFMKQTEPKLVSVLASRREPYDNFASIHKRCSLKE